MAGVAVLHTSVCEHTISMVDNHDGTVTATVPPEWVQQKGSYFFHFFQGGREFEPTLDFDGHNPCQNVVDKKARESCNASDTLRTIKFFPRQCPPTSHTIADELTGSRCICEDGFEIDIGANTTSCHRSCDKGAELSRYNTCQCSDGYYNASAEGVLLCQKDSWVQPENNVMPEHAECSPCPAACTTCNNGLVTLKSGWGLVNSSADHLAHSVEINSRVQWIFQCPNAGYQEASCPEKRLDAAQAHNSSCLLNHTGALCDLCLPGYSRKMSDNSCVDCVDYHRIQNQFGVSLHWLIFWGILAAAVSAVSVYAGQKIIKKVKNELFTNLKICLGLAQVLSLLKDVLSLVFPPQPQHVFSYAAVSTMDLRIIFALDCWHLTWFEKWTLTVFIFPGAIIAAIVLQYVFERYRNGCVPRKSDTQKLLRNGFFVVMLLYPRVSTAVLSIFRCRRLSAHVNVLDADYSIDCNSLNYMFHYRAAVAMVLVWMIGIPFGLLATMCRHARRDRFREEIRPVKILHKCDDSNTSMLKQGWRASYSFCTDAYRKECFYFEPIDMIRKLALSGLLQFVERGTAAQVFVGCVLAFGFFGLQTHLKPYLEPEANALKAFVEAQIFLTFLVSLLIRVTPRIDSAEPVGPTFYGHIIVFSLLCFGCAAITISSSQIYRRWHFRSGLQTTIAAAIPNFGGGFDEHQVHEMGEISHRMSHGMMRLQVGQALD